MYTVYKHTNKKNGKVYIGITKQCVERRWQNGNGYKGTYFWNAIQKYGWFGFEHEVLFSGLTKQAACEMEQFLIIYHRSNERAFGYNIAEGGQTGDNLTARYGHDNNRAVGVRRIDPKTGEVVIYQTIRAAANDIKANHRGISKCCRGAVNTYMGYIWEYATREYEKPKNHGVGKYPHIKQMKKVVLVDEYGAKHLFGSVKAAAEYVGMRPSNVTRYLKGQRKDKTGRRWIFDR